MAGMHTLFHELGLTGVLISAVFIAWFAVSVPHQFTNKIGNRIKRLNTFGLIPGWTFFAPTPGMTDYRFVFRDILPEGSTDWKEVDWCASRRLRDAAWHVQRHRVKLVVDCINGFLLTVVEMRKLDLLSEGETPGWILSIPYLALLNIALSMPRESKDARARQFAILEQKPTESLDGSRLIVCSAPHDFA